MSRNKHKRKVSKKQLGGFKSYRQLENWMVETRNKLVDGKNYFASKKDWKNYKSK